MDVVATLMDAYLSVLMVYGPINFDAGCLSTLTGGFALYISTVYLHYAFTYYYVSYLLFCILPIYYLPIYLLIVCSKIV